MGVMQTKTHTTRAVASAVAPNVDPVLLTEAEAAEMLRASIHTLRCWRSLGKGPRIVRQGPKFVRYRRSDLEAWAEEIAR